MFFHLLSNFWIGEHTRLAFLMFSLRLSDWFWQEALLFFLVVPRQLSWTNCISTCENAAIQFVLKDISLESTLLTFHCHAFGKFSVSFLVCVVAAVLFEAAWILALVSSWVLLMWDGASSGSCGLCRCDVFKKEVDMASRDISRHGEVGLGLDWAKKCCSQKSSNVKFPFSLLTCMSILKRTGSR